MKQQEPNLHKLLNNVHCIRRRTEPLIFLIKLIPCETSKDFKTGSAIDSQIKEKHENFVETQHLRQQQENGN